MRNSPKLLAVLALFASGLTVAEESVLPERATSIMVSNRDVNRIHCRQGVQDVIWSAEKPVKVNKTDENVFVKFLLARQGESEQRVTSPLDVHVICGGAVYTMILHPRDMDSVTVRLGDERRAQLTATAKEWGALALEDRIKRFTLALYRNELPDTFAKKFLQPGDARRSVALFENADLVGQYEVSAPGTGLKATEYVVHAREAMQLSERDFLAPELGEVVGVTVEPLNIAANDFARLIVIERAPVGSGL